jgi:hypothetical protein
LPLDFSKLEQYKLDELVERRPGHSRKVKYSCEDTSSELIHMIIS